MVVAYWLRKLWQRMEGHQESSVENEFKEEARDDFNEDYLTTLGVSLGYRKKALREIRHGKRIDVTLAEISIIFIPLFVLGAGSLFFWKYGYASIEVPKEWYLTDKGKLISYSEVSGRFKFLSTQFLLFFVQLIIIVFFIYEISTFLSPRSILKIILGGATSGIVFIASIQWIDWPFGWVKAYLGKIFIETAMNDLWFLACQNSKADGCSSKYLSDVVWISNRIFMLAAIAIVMGTISCLARYRCGKKTYVTDVLLSQQMKRLKRYIYLGSILFVVGLLHAYLLYGWSSFAISNESDFLPIYNDLLNNLALYFGIYYSAALASFYIPVVSILVIRVNLLAVILIKCDNKKVSPENIESWKADNGLTLTTTDYAKSIFAILGPFFAGALGTFGEAVSSVGSVIPQ